MTKLEILSLCKTNFQKGFAQEQGQRMIKGNNISKVFELLSDLIIFSTLSQEEKANSAYNYLNCIKRSDLIRIEFRVAYVFDYIYFSDNEYFDKYHSLLFSLFPKVSNESTKRHFSRIMTDILTKYTFVSKPADYESVATTCVDWIINEKVKIAVQIWAIECLIILKNKVIWIPDLLDDLFLKLRINPSAGMKVRLKKWK